MLYDPGTRENRCVLNDPSTRELWPWKAEKGGFGSGEPMSVSTSEGHERCFGFGKPKYVIWLRKAKKGNLTSEGHEERVVLVSEER